MGHQLLPLGGDPPFQSNKLLLKTVPFAMGLLTGLNGNIEATSGIANGHASGGNNLHMLEALDLLPLPTAGPKGFHELLGRSPCQLSLRS